MEKTMLIRLTNKKAIKLLHELEELHLIEVLKENIRSATSRLSNRYKGIISKSEGEKLKKHIRQIRSEWNNTL